MTPVEYAFVITLAVLLSIFFLLLIGIAGVTIKILLTVKGIIAHAENAVATAEEAAEVFRETSGKMAMVKLIRNIIKLVNRK